jgi:hypothetical protein
MRNWLQWLAGDEPTSTDIPIAPTCLGGTLGETADCALPNRQSLQRLASLFVLLGLLARVVRYYLGFPLWDDESFLCVNFISRAELLQPLDYHQVAPVLFLWMQRTAVNLFGFSEYSLRLAPFVFSIASVFLFRRTAERLLSGPALVFAVAIFAVSYSGIRYAAEAKPYCTDMFVSLVILSLVVEWQQRRETRELWWLAAVMPLALGLSYPAVFAAGGLSLVVGATLWCNAGRASEWRAWFVWNVALVMSFVFWFSIVGRVQSGAEGEFMGEFWKQNFPPIREPWNVPYWLLKTHASDFLAYPLGGPNWASTLTLIICSAGLWRLVRQRHLFWLGLVLGPASLHLLAAALQRYPYGGHVKFSQYLAPMICCLAAVGLVQLLDWQRRQNGSLKRAFAVCCAILMVIGCGDIARDLANPYKTRSDYRARAFAQAFWVGAHSAEEVCCLKSDLGLDFVPGQHRELSWSAHYLCNRAIEVSRSSLRPANPVRVSADRPLRCVFYQDARYELDQTRLAAWLAEMQEKYQLVAHERLPFPRMTKNERRLVTMEYINSYKFIPRDGSPNGVTPLADGRQTPPR